jgi:pimeloyl-ACP methyl ester carboxylesterase
VGSGAGRRKPWLIGLALGAVFSGCSAILFHPKRQDAGRTCPESFRDYRVASGSGHILRMRRYLSDSARGTVVYFYGNSKNLSYRCGDFNWLLRKGYELVLFDYSGYGPSEGEPGLDAMRRDGISVMRFVRDSLRPPATAYLGTSLGGALLLSAYSQWPDRPAQGLLILDSAFPSFRSIGAGYFRASLIGWPLAFLPWIFMSGRDEPDHAIGVLADTRALITHCRGDEVIPFREGRKLFAEYPGPKVFWDLGGCGHSRGFASEHPAHRERLARFLDSSFRAGSPLIRD